MVDLNVTYVKRKNTSIFQELEKKVFVNIQNYSPIYNKFLLLNETNYNSVNLNHTFFLKDVLVNLEDYDCGKNIWDCLVEDIESGQNTSTRVFFKMAPLLDPFKYLIGKYNATDDSLFTLPSLIEGSPLPHAKINDPNNSAYVDGLFSFLSSRLIYKYNFLNGVDYYGSFVGIQNNFTMNISDDLDYLVKSEYFNKNKGVLFTTDDYSFLTKSDIDNSVKKLPLIKIDSEESETNILTTSIESIENELFDNLFLDTNDNTYTLDTLKEQNLDLIDILNNDIEINDTDLKATIKSGSTCSSRTSHTSKDTKEDSESKWDTASDEADEESLDSNDNQSTSASTNINEDEYCVNAVIPKFPVLMICMENCKNTFDNLILDNDLSEDEWLSALMQVIMILISYQKAFSFTHNDLHTNNIMYVKTNEKWIYYCYKKKYYKVPTFGRIFKIIDFGRAIYKYQGQLFCSDSFQPGGDADTQYNTEPYFKPDKARIEPNNSFDLCRLACSIFDYVIDDLDEINDLDNCETIARIIYEWCLDDNGVNILYKNNGQERYPDFKLYKMISRCVHHHTPQAQLERNEFAKFLTSKNHMSKVNPSNIVNIDTIPSFA
jgi:hypothetical protein